MTYQPAQVAKAIAASVTAGLGALTAAGADGKLGVVEIIVVLGTAIVAGAATFYVPNQP